MPDPLLAVRNLRFDYPPNESGFTLNLEQMDIEAGELVAITGGNGAGKTTLLKLLNGLLAPSGGSILFHGHPVDGTGIAELRRSSVLVHQDPYLFGGTVSWNVGYGLRIRRRSRPEISDKVAEKLALVGLEGFGLHRARALSGGERQRVAIARALVLEPEVLLMDEPTAHMDNPSIRQLESALHNLHRRGTTILMSSHRPDFAYRLADRIVPMEAGRFSVLRENIYKGRVVRSDDRFTYFHIEGGELLCPVQENEFSTVVLPTNDVILSDAPVETSAQNRFRGRVRSLERFDHLVQVEVDCGFFIKASITEYSRERMDVQPGRPLTATFKASALRLY